MVLQYIKDINSAPGEKRVSDTSTLRVWRVQAGGGGVNGEGVRGGVGEDVGRGHRG